MSSTFTPPDILELNDGTAATSLQVEAILAARGIPRRLGVCTVLNDLWFGGVFWVLQWQECVL